MQEVYWKLNTSNLNKAKEFKLLFNQYGHSLEIIPVDLKEIEAEPLMVITHKASQIDENILVEDTSLDIENASVGIHIRWLLDHLSHYVNREACWVTLLAYRQGQQIFIYKGDVSGKIVEPIGKLGFGFDPVFLPNEATETLAQSKPDQFNARAKVVQALLLGNVYTTLPMIEKWEGPWQKNHHE